MKKEYFNLLLILLIFLVSLYIIRILKLTGICFIILSILSPVFFGYVLAWILKPIVDKIKFNRVVTTLFIYILFLLLLGIVIFNLFPIILDELKKIIPVIKYYILHNNILYNLYQSLNIKEFLSMYIKNMNNYLNNFFSIVMNIIYSLIFGFYFLVKKDNICYFKFVPNQLRINISKDLRLYIKSIMLDTLFMFIILSICFKVIGLDSSYIFALFCAITNIIPYIGPYIGGVPAVLLALSNGINNGITVLVIIVLVQMIENNIIQPLIVSKNVNLNPIYILIGIIIFSHFLGILGMVISTPILLIIRNVFLYYKKNKPKWFNLILDI